MKKLLVFIVVMVLIVFGFQPKALAETPTVSYIKVTSYVAVTNGVGSFNYYMYVESYTTNKTRSVWGLVTTNLVSGLWVKGDTTKVKYDFAYRSVTNNYYYDRFLCISGGATDRFFKPSMDTPWFIQSVRTQLKT